MDITCNIAFTDGTYITLDGYDEIYFYEILPYIRLTYRGYDLQNNQEVYYDVLNNLQNYPFIGIKRADSSDEMDFAGKKYAYKHYHSSTKNYDERNETLYVQTSAISTIAVYEQWK